jgi:hypothetical protein
MKKRELELESKMIEEHQLQQESMATLQQQISS